MTRMRVLWICIGFAATCAVIGRAFERDIAIGMAKRRLHTLHMKVEANPSDERSVADLMRIAEDQAYSATVREGAVQILGGVGVSRKRPEEIVTFLGKISGDEPNYLRQSACDALGDMGPAASMAVDDVLKAMKSYPGSSVESRCARALGRIRADPEKVVPALASLIPNRDPVTNQPSFCRGEELAALEAFGKSAIAAIPKLELAASDPDVEYRQAAVAALSKVDPKNPRLGPAALSLVTATDFVARHFGLTALEVCCRESIHGEMARIVAHTTCDSDIENANLARRLLTESGVDTAECPSK